MSEGAFLHPRPELDAVEAFALRADLIRRGVIRPRSFSESDRPADWIDAPTLTIDPKEKK